jgi:hypothetical protein
MTSDGPAEILAILNKKAKAFDAAVNAGDAPAARTIAEECSRLYRQLARKVPLREHEYLTRAKAWEEKRGAVDASAAGEPPGPGPAEEFPPSAGGKTQQPAGISPQAGTPSPPSVPHAVFLSYSHPDRGIADAVCSYLETHTVPCWMAPRDILPGRSFPESIIDAIDRSRIVVLIFSRHSNASPHVVRELTRAVSRNIPIVPFRVEDILPSKNMEYLINVPHWMEAAAPPVESHFPELLETIRAHLAQMEKKDIPEDTPRGG